MSGMSHDGLDLALVKISGTHPQLKIELKDFASFDYDDETYEKISRLKSSSLKEISEMNFNLAYFYAECVNKFLESRKIDRSTIDAIGSHGQTIFHQTLDTRHPSTLQIVSGSVIANSTGIFTVTNFREADIAVGGQGAPLVPYVDYLLFKDATLPLAVNNLGSISNLTLITKDPSNMIAFDTGPANMPIDYFVKKTTRNQKKFDVNGEMSKNGSIISQMLDEMMTNPYLAKEPPKAAGYQEFGPSYCDELSLKFPNHSPEDYIRTALEFSSTSIANAYKDIVLKRCPDLKKIIFTGGGSKNPTLISSIKEKLPKTIKIESLSESNSTFSNAKEAMAFAVLANEFLAGRPGNVPSVTGAKKLAILGQLSCPLRS